jgi:hypothetical protein
MPRILRALRPEECCNQVRCQIAIFVGLVSATLSLLPFGFADPKGASVLSPKYEVFCCDQNGPPARREEGAYLNPYVTDEQRGRRPIFIATLRAGASWLFFRSARSTRMTQIWALRSRLEKQPTDLRQITSYFGDRTLGTVRVSMSKSLSER